MMDYSSYHFLEIIERILTPSSEYSLNLSSLMHCKKFTVKVYEGLVYV